MISTAEAAAIGFRHRQVLAEYLAKVTPAALVGVIGALEAARQDRQPVYVAGNGGSAANASHLLLHLRQAGLLAIDLGHTPLLTAIANDVDYEHAFSDQSLGRATVVAISCSGHSPNIINLLRQNHEQGGTNIGILGFDGGKAIGLCDHAIMLYGMDYGILEDAHSAVVHMIAEALLGERYR